MATPAYLIQGKNIILVMNGKSHTISKDSHINYAKIIEALKAQDWDELEDLVEPKKAIVNFGKGYVSIEGDEVFWKDQPFHNALSTRMMTMFQDGFPIDPMVRFMENLMDNPSKRSVDQLYGFLEKNSLPITEDGHFLAFKKVNYDYKDIHSGKFDNSIGQIVEMERNLVDDNPDSHCSVGLHFCSESYLNSFGSHDQPIMILKINPADVVSIPTDYNGAKGRCMRYEVVGQVSGDAKNAFASIVNSDYSEDDDVIDNTDPDDYDEGHSGSTPKAAWPFPLNKPAVGGCGNCDSCTSCGDDDDNAEFKDDETYNVVRAYGGTIVASNLTYDEANAMVQKAARQKKAVLKAVPN